MPSVKLSSLNDMSNNDLQILIDHLSGLDLKAHRASNPWNDGLEVGNYSEWQKLPEWWKNNTRVAIENYGNFDLRHVGRGYNTAVWMHNDLNRALEEGDNPWLVGDKDRFHQYYEIPENLTDKNRTEFLLETYKEYEIAYEESQILSKSAPSAFAAEDLPSDYFGFMMALQGHNYSDLPEKLLQLGGISEVGGNGFTLNDWSWGDGFGWPPVVLNSEFRPIVNNEGEWQHVDWPHWVDEYPK